MQNKDKDSRTKPYITLSDAWTAAGYDLDNDDGARSKLLESPFLNVDDGNNKTK